jgi:sulfite reductase (NADPH) flavoprotein alpha-component
MSAIPNNPNASLIAPLSVDLDHQVQVLLHDLDRDSLWWISGYAAALARTKTLSIAHAEIANTDIRTKLGEPLQAETSASSASYPITVLYGSQTGNSERIARALLAKLESNGNNARLLRADEYNLKQLSTERLLFAVFSTQGDGDPPEDSRLLFQQLLSSRAPKLPHLQFSVLGLGDSSYPKFNQAAITFADRLKALGASSLVDTALADVQIEDIALPWQQLCKARAQEIAQAKPSNVTTLLLKSKAEAHTHQDALTIDAVVVCNQRITSAHSSKDIRHIELSVEGKRFHYEPGDALLVHSENSDALIEEILQLLEWDSPNQDELRNILKRQKEITRLARPTLKLLAERGACLPRHLIGETSANSKALLADNQNSGTRDQALALYLQSTQLVDALIEAGVKLSAAELIATLPALKPRAYSIASSQKSVGEEVHLTVARVQYGRGEKQRFGLASNALARSNLDDLKRVQLERNSRFRLGADNQNIIMIGPGTGVAPFRAFVQERAETGAKGKNWLFFGNPHFRHDFLYQLEWQRALKTKQLHRLDVAFSRDGSEKVYVQHRLREQAREVFAWLESGAAIYLCGDAKNMAKDVEATLLEIIAQQSGRDADFAQDYLNELSANKRYLRDVY